jgi:hypothetical protein
MIVVIAASHQVTRSDQRGYRHGRCAAAVGDADESFLDDVYVECE